MSEPMLDKSKISIKRDGYGTASYTNLRDQGLIAIARDFKRSLSGRMYPLDKESIARKIGNSQYHVSRKVDGEFNLLFKDGSEIWTLNPGGTVRVGLPWMQEAAEHLDKAGVNRAVIAGELYLHKPDGKRPRVHDIVSAARNPKSSDELSRIAFAVFDLVSLEDQTCRPEDFDDYWKKIQQSVTGTRFHPVESCSVTSAKDVQTLYEQWVEQEYAEGLVVRGEAGGLFKIKPRHNLDAVIIGFTESTGEREGMLHDILVGLKRADGALQVLTKVGGGFTDEQRRELLSDLKDELVESEYAEVNSDHVAYQMVVPKRIVEISLLDLVAETTRGGPVNRMVLDFDKEYRVIRRFPLASVISPQFIRLREDKTADAQDIGIHQVANLVNVDDFDQNVKELVFPKSEILSRAVYAKEAKGSRMVRKFVVFKTNKQKQSNDYPAYVFHYTDFSPNRKNPLAREVRVSSSLGQVTAIRDQFIKDNIKKGWAEIANDADATARRLTVAAETMESNQKEAEGDAPEGDKESKPVVKKTVKKKTANRKTVKKKKAAKKKKKKS